MEYVDDRKVVALYWDMGLGKTYHEFKREAQEYADRIAEQYKADDCEFDVPIYEKTIY